MSDQNTIQTDNRIVRAETQHYADLVAQVIRDEIKEAEVLKRKLSRQGLRMKLAILTLGLLLCLVGVAVGLDLYLSATLTGVPGIIVEVINGIKE